MHGVQPYHAKDKCTLNLVWNRLAVVGEVHGITIRKEDIVRDFVPRSLPRYIFAKEYKTRMRDDTNAILTDSKLKHICERECE